MDIEHRAPNCDWGDKMKNWTIPFTYFQIEINAPSSEYIIIQDKTRHSFINSTILLFRSIFQVHRPYASYSHAKHIQPDQQAYIKQSTLKSKSA